MEINSWRIILTIETITERSYDTFGREGRVVPNFRDGPVIRVGFASPVPSDCSFSPNLYSHRQKTPGGFFIQQNFGSGRL